MRAFYTATDEVRISLPPTHRIGLYRQSVIVRTVDFDELKAQILDGDPVRAELKRSLDDTLSLVQRLSDERDNWKNAAESHAAEVAKWVDWRHDAVAEREKMRDLLRGEKERADAAIERESVGEAAYDELAEELASLRMQLAVYKLHDNVKRVGESFVIHTTAAEKRDWESSDLVTADVLDKIAATAPVGSLVDDLKNTIVSQAREIARLKGESA